MLFESSYFRKIFFSHVFPIIFLMSCLVITVHNGKNFTEVLDSVYIKILFNGEEKLTQSVKGDVNPKFNESICLLLF
jgi:hypothetical protein